MTTTEEPKVETKKVFDLEKMEHVEVPVKPAVEAKKEEPKEKEEEVEETEEEVNEEESEEGEEKKEEESEEEEESSEEKPVDKKKEEKKDEPAEPVAIDDYLKEKYQDYEINSEEDLDEVLESMDVLVKRNEALEKELETAKSDKPKFASKAQEELYNFVKDVDPARLGDRMQVYARLIGMDVEKENPRLLLEEQFILGHPELSRDRALKKFNHEYDKQYGELNRDDFDSDKAFKDAKELREIDLEDDVHKARKVIKAEQAKLKTEITTQTDDKPKENPVVVEKIKAISSELDDYVKEFNELIFSPTDKEDDDFHFKLSKEQVKNIHNAVKVWVKNPTSYDAKGNLIGGWKIDEQIKQTAYLLYGDDIVEQNYQHALRLKDITRAEEIAVKKPDRKAKTAGDDVRVSMSEDKQWEMLIKKKKANAGSKGMVYK